MRAIIYILFVLNIYTTFSSQLKAQVLTLKIEGHSPLETLQIDSLNYKASHADYSSLSSEIDSTKSKFIQLGYYDLLESQRIKQSDSSYLSKLRLGVLYKELRLGIPESPALKTYIKELDLDIENASIILKPAFAKAFLEQLTQIAASRGKPFSSFQITELSKREGNSIDGQLIFTEDSTRYINKIIIEGYKKVPQTFLKRYVGLKKGGVFNQKELIAKQNALNTLPFVSSKRDLEVQFTQDSTNVYLYLEKQSTNRFDGFLGFATNEITNKLQLDGYLDLALTNNLNYGESLAINYKSDGDDQQQLRVNLDMPYLFGSPIGAALELHLFRKDTTFSENTQAASLYYQINPKTRFNLGYKRKTSDNLLDMANSLPDVIDYSLNRITGGLNYDVLQNSFLFPKKYFFHAQGEIGRRSTDLIDEDQLSLSAAGGAIFNLNTNNQLYIKSTTQLLFSDNYVTNELFRFGGITSIRGFEENSIFANLTTVFNTEYRYILNNSTYIHSIIDAGYFENETLNLKTKLFSVGFGAGIGTKAGIFKINIANGKSDGQEFKFSNTKIHLQLESRF